MITPIRLILSALLALLILTGCVADSNKNTARDRVGYFIDSHVKGLEYVTTSGNKGITNQLGQFFYQDNDEVTFSIGQLELGSAKPSTEGLISPESLAKNAWQQGNKQGNKHSNKQNTMEVLLLRLLQSIDLDRKSDNGITISPQIAYQLSTIQKTKLAELTETSVLALNNDLQQALDKDNDGSIDISASKAKQHAKASLTNWNLGKRPEQNQQKNKTKPATEIDYGERTQQNKPLNKHQKFSLAYLWSKQRLASNLYAAFNQDFNDDLFSSNAVASKVYQQKVESIIKQYNLNISDLAHFHGSYSASELSATAQNNYAIKSIQDAYKSLSQKGKKSLNNALQAACMLETSNIDELERFIEIANTPYNRDLTPLFKRLQKQSYQHHWELDNTLKKQGIVQGCASMGSAYKKIDYDNISVDSQLNYYLVYGNSSSEVRYNMNQNTNRPKPYDAYTKWSVSWHYSWQLSNGRCKVSSANANVKIAMLLPKLSNLSDRPKALKEQWSAYITALKEHENGHREIGLNVANDTLQHILKTPPQTSCDALKTAINHVVAERVSASKNNDKIYDDATNHGLNEGAEFH